MDKIYSKIEKDKLLHIVCRLNNMEESLKEINSHRIDIVPDDNFIQCSFLKMDEGKTFKPHKHIKKEKFYKQQIAQESWIIIKGRVKAIFYDLDDTIIATPVLEAGDTSFTLEGGHNYEILEDNTIVLEFKTGPYEGQKLDKVFI